MYAGKLEDANGNDYYPAPYFPIGSIYMNTTNINPSVYFGGSWTQIKDKFLLCAGDNYSGGSGGGSATINYTPSGTVGGHTLTSAEIPSHTHTYNVSSSTTQSHTLTIAEMPSHSHSLHVAWGTEGTMTYYDLKGNWFSSIARNTDQIDSTGGNGGHSHGISLSSTTTGSYGSGGAHNHSFGGNTASWSNLPPYLTVYVWYRTA